MPSPRCRISGPISRTCLRLETGWMRCARSLATSSAVLWAWATAMAGCSCAVTGHDARNGTVGADPRIVAVPLCLRKRRRYLRNQRLTGIREITDVAEPGRPQTEFSEARRTQGAAALNGGAGWLDGIWLRSR